MTAIVTGGCGFIGSHLARRLIAKGEDVRIIDDMSKGRIERISDIINNIELFKVDIRNYEEILNIFKNVDKVFHLAAQVSVFNSLEDPYFDASVNILGTINVLKAAVVSKVDRFVYVSSAAIYGNPVEVPITEEHPKAPLSPYGLSKLIGERYSLLFKYLNDLKVSVIRPFNVYGPGQDPNDEYAGVITKFITRVLEGKSPIVFGGNQTRDFVYVEDVVEGAILASEKEEAIGESFNIASGKEITIDELAKIIIKISGKDLDIIHQPLRKGDIERSIADISKAQQILGYKPKIELETGLAKVYDFFKNM